MTAYLTPWEEDSLFPATIPDLERPIIAKPRGRRPASVRLKALAPAWLYHHLIITGPTAEIIAFATAARGSGVIPWQIDAAAMEEDVFNLAVSQPVAHRTLTIQGCRILASQFRDRVEARQVRAAAVFGHSSACPFDLHILLPIPESILHQGSMHPSALAWTKRHWGVGDTLRHVVRLFAPRPGRRLPKEHGVLGYGFFTSGDTPHAAIAQLAPRWPTLSLTLQPRPD